MPDETGAPGAAGPTPFPPPPIGALMLRRRNAFLVAGRMSRPWFALAAVLILAPSIAVWFAPAARHQVWFMASPFWMSAYGRRLHDIGRSGWWQLPVLLFSLWGIAAGAGGMTMLIAAAAVQLVFTVGLGLVRGDPQANRFGAPPGRPAAQADVFE